MGRLLALTVSMLRKQRLRVIGWLSRASGVNSA